MMSEEESCDNDTVPVSPQQPAALNWIVRLSSREAFLQERFPLKTHGDMKGLKL